jgi:hypothetical protein
MNKYIYFVFLLLTVSVIIIPQSRIEYRDRQLFLNGSNFAWVNFASDIGPGNTNFPKFSQIFAEVKAAGGNSMRLWLHTDGSKTPEFNSNGYVVGPGADAIDDLNQILDLAQQNEVGVLLCLWSHDMLRSSNSQVILSRNTLLLSDTLAARAYINNALIPLIEGVQGHPAIIAWEIFNEPEGISNELGWSGWDHVPMFYIQRFINLTSGAIHRVDPEAKVTNGSGNISALTDVPTLAKQSPEAVYNSLTEEQKQNLERWFETKYRIHHTAKQITEEYFPNDVSSYNYYTDTRLISAGGDPLGILDFYTTHWYTSGGQNTSPFHHSYTYWNLNKPLVVAEFFMTDLYSGVNFISYKNLYDTLFENGYAGAMSWQWWGDTEASDYSGDHSRTVAAMTKLYQNHPEDIVVNPKSGTIYNFGISPMAIEKGDSSLIQWKTEAGSSVTLNGQNVSYQGSMTVKPFTTTTYELVADGYIHMNKSLRLEVHPAGRIFTFSALPSQIETGESSLLKWRTARGSVVTMNGIAVGEKDSMLVSPTETTSYVLQTNGDISESQEVFIYVLPALSVNRALGKPVSVSSSEVGLGNDDPQYLVDGDFFTRWSSAYSESQWIIIDLLNTYNVQIIKLFWADSYAKIYRFGLGVDLNNFGLIRTIANSNGGVEIYDNLNTEARYLKIMLDKRAIPTLGYSLIEIEVYGLRKSSNAEDNNTQTPLSFSLSQNYPNPFNPTTKIKFSIPTSPPTPSPYQGEGHRERWVTLKVYDILGNEIATLVNEVKLAGNYEVEFDGSSFSSGVYFYKINAGKFIKTGKMILLK